VQSRAKLSPLFDFNYENGNTTKGEAYDAPDEVKVTSVQAKCATKISLTGVHASDSVDQLKAASMNYTHAKLLSGNFVKSKDMTTALMWGSSPAQAELKRLGQKSNIRSFSANAKSTLYKGELD